MTKRASKTPESEPVTVYNEQVDFAMIPVAAISESPLNPRRHIDKAKLDELTVSVRQHGVLQPIVVRAVGLEQKQGTYFVDPVVRYEVVAGARRLRAAIAAPIERIPAVIRSVTDVQLVELAVTENSQREDVHPLEEAEGLKRLQEMDPIYRDPKVLAAKIGRSETFLRDRLNLAGLVDVAKDAFERDVITTRHAEMIARLPADQQPKAFAKCFSDFLTLGSHHYTPVKEAIEKRAWEALREALMGTRELGKWVKEHAKRPLSSPEVQQVLEPIIDEEFTDTTDTPENVEKFTAKFLQLSERGGYEFNRQHASAAGVISKDNYKVITKAAQRCKYTKRGVIVHPDTAKPRALEVCTSRICSKHWPKPKSSSAGASSASHKPSAAAVAKEQAAKVQREAEQKAWTEMRPALTAAFIRHLAGAKVNAAFVRRLIAIDQYEVMLADEKQVKRDYGVALTDKTVGQFLALSAIGDYKFASQKDFEPIAKLFGFNLATFIKKQASVVPAKKGKAA